MLPVVQCLIYCNCLDNQQSCGVLHSQCFNIAKASRSKDFFFVRTFLYITVPLIPSKKIKMTVI